MTKLHFPKLSHPLLLSVFFFAGLEIAFSFQQFLVPTIAVLILVVFLGVGLVRYEELGFFRPYQMILPVIATLAFSGFALFLPKNAWLDVYSVVCGVCMYLILTHGAKHAYPTWNMVLSLIVLLLSLAGILGSRFHLYIPVPIAVGVAFFVTTVMCAQTLVRYEKSPAEAWLMASILGLIVSETIWVLQFLPLHFMVQAGVVLSILYSGYGLAIARTEHNLTKQTALQHISLSVIALAALLLTARWQ